MIITVPPLGSLVGNLPTAAWFRGAYADRAASPRSIVRVSAVGLVARLWRTAGSPRDMFAAAVDGHALPCDRALDWARANKATIDPLVSVAILDAQDLIEDIHWMRQRAPWGNDGLVRSVVVRRDDLESFARLAREVGAASEVDGLLRELDALAVESVSASVFDLGQNDSDLAREVSVAEPMAWWGSSAREDRASTARNETA